MITIPGLRSPREERVLAEQLAQLRERGGVVLVGQQPNAACARYPEGWLLPTDGRTHHTANRLRDYCGLTTGEYERCFAVRTNADDGVAEFRAERAAARLGDLVRRLHRALVCPSAAECVINRVPAEGQVRLLLLGRKAWGALQRCVPPAERAPRLAKFAWNPHTYAEQLWFPDGRRDPGAPQGVWRTLRLRAAYVPHTSGMTREYNSPEQRAALREFVVKLREETRR